MSKDSHCLGWTSAIGPATNTIEAFVTLDTLTKQQVFRSLEEYLHKLGA
jgi:hypothetical protein